MKLPNIVFKPHPIDAFGGVIAAYKDWSIICGPSSYGGKQGLYEVMGPGFGEHGDVEGCLTLPEVLLRIALHEEKESVL